MSAVADGLLDGAPDAISRARLLATSAKESGAWLYALPISSSGLRMDDNTIRVAVGLCIGAPLGRPHLCHHCGANVDHLALHGLSCQRSQGRFHHHAALNDIVHRSLAAAQVPSRLEPTGIVHSVGKRPDGVSLVPWKCGRLLVWDVTCPDMYAPSYVAGATSEAGAVAVLAETKKKSKYSFLDSGHSFLPVVCESSGVIGPLALAFLRELGSRLSQISGEPKSHQYLLQRVSVAVQRGNTASVMGSFGP